MAGALAAVTACDATSPHEAASPEPPATAPASTADEAPPPSSSSAAPETTPETPPQTAPDATPEAAPAPGPALLSDAEAKRLASASNALGADLYQKLRGNKGNFTFSPASIATALAMPWAGAKGETADQIKKVLHADGSKKDVAPLFGRLARTLQDPSRALKLKIANRLFGERSYTFEKPFLEVMSKDFAAPLEPVDYRGAAEDARVRINGWVETQTEKRIVDLLGPGAIGDDTRLTLVNALYFLGEWVVPFQPRATELSEFSITKSQKKDVPTMRLKTSAQYAEKDGVLALELPYKGSASMLFVLPKDPDGIDALEKSLTQKKIDALSGALSMKFVDIALPKFTIQPGSALELGDALKALGMRSAFDKRTADFTGIADPADRDDRICIGEVVHKAFVKVDEKGTEAAAATAVIMTRVTSAEIITTPPPVPFHADHPFLFFLRDDATGLILFMGRVSDPAS